MDFAIPTYHRVKIKENEKSDNYLDLARELKKSKEHKGVVDTNCNWCTWNDPRRLSKRTREVENRKTMNRDHPNNGIVEVGQNTE